MCVFFIFTNGRTGFVQKPSPLSLTFSLITDHYSVYCYVPNAFFFLYLILAIGIQNNSRSHIQCGFKLTNVFDLNF